MKKLCLLLVTLTTLISCNTDSKHNFDWQGHRGARGAYPENTIPAFIFALDEGMNTLEMDVVITADKQVVVSHEPFFNPMICNVNFVVDEGLDSLEDANNIYHWSYDDVVLVDCGSLEHPRFPDQKKMKVNKPLLRHVIDTAEAYARANDLPKPHYNIEIKSRPEWDTKFHPEAQEYVNLVMEIVKSAGVRKRTVIQSFDYRPLQFLHIEYPKVSLALLVEDEISVETHLQKLGFIPEIYSCYYPLVNEQLVLFCHEKGMQIIPWTVNTMEEIERLQHLGVDGVITDFPQLKRQVSRLSPKND